ncbi:MAG: GNAT family N-acetyltransferase [Spirochaeta sp.]
MHIRDFTPKDTARIAPLQPADWPPITEVFQWYLDHTGILPVKAEMDGRLCAIGAAVLYESTGWLAHIITHPAYRRQGIAFSIVQELIERLHRENCTSISLFATEEGAPLYMKAGFRRDTRYRFFRTPEKPHGDIPDQPDIRIASDSEHRDILELDFRASGENRRSILAPELPNAVVYHNSGRIQGYFLPSLAEGPVIAETPDAARALLRHKTHNTSLSKSTVPTENTMAADLLIETGWTETMQADRMILGDTIPYRPELIFSRIAGNLG